MAHAGHQVLIDLMPDGLLAAACRSLPRLPCLEDRGGGIERFFDQAFGLVYALSDVRLHDSLPREAIDVDVHVRGDHDAFAMLDLFVGQDVLRAARAAGLHLDRDPQLLGFVFEGLLCHIGVGDARRTSRDREDAGEAVLDDLVFFEFRALRVVDHLEEVLDRPCCDEFVLEFFVHQHLAQSRKHVEVDVVFAVRGSDQEEQLHGFSVQRLVFDAVRDDHRGEGGLLHALALAVRDGDAFSDTGGRLFLSLEDAFLIDFDVFDDAALRHQGNGLPDHVFF